MRQAGVSPTLPETTAARDSFASTPTYASEPALHAAGLAGVDLNVALQGALLALIRIAMGFFWLQESLGKLPGHTTFFKNLLMMVAKNTWVPGYAGIVNTFFVPHATLFALFVYLLETSIALSLLFGLFTRLGGAAGAIWGTLLFCGLAYGKGPGSGAWYFGMIVLMCALLALTAAGRSLGVDRWLRPVLAQRAARGDRRARYLALAE